MARPSPQTQAKRARERSKMEKRKAKEEKRALRKDQEARQVSRPTFPAEGSASKE